MGRASCIAHPPAVERHDGEPIDNKFVVLRRDYLELMGGDACAAMLLHVAEHWHNAKLTILEENPGDRNGLWWYRSHEDLARLDLLGAFGRAKVRRGVGTLIARGFLKKRRNPFVGFDRMWQYRFEVEVVQEAINRLECEWSKKTNGEVQKDQSNGPTGTNAKV